MVLCNLAQGPIDIFGHLAGVATDVQLRTLLQPAPQVCTLFANPVLHVDLL
ncbi:hypothetical protein D3C85_1776510 [compost metagenome]